MSLPKFYYDPKTGILYVENQNNVIPVVTSASLDPTSCGLSSEGVLMLKDFEGNWRAMTDPETNESISLIGPKGEQGVQGEPGLNGLDGANGLTPNITISGEGIATIEYVKDFISPDSPIVMDLKGPKGDSGLTPDIKLDDQGNLSIEYKVLTDIPTAIQMNIKGEPGRTAIPNLDENGNLSWTISDTSNIPSPINIRGPQGLQGPQGDKGEQGPQGIQGESGEDGATFTPSVDDAGNLTWTNNRELPNPATLNIKGPKGEAGIDGIAYVPSVSTEGLLTWSTVSSLNEIQAVNIKGPQGEAGVGFATTFPPNPKLGDTFTWGGESKLNTDEDGGTCFLGYVMNGQQYIYSQLPAKFESLLSSTEILHLMPLHILMYIPSLIMSGSGVSLTRSSQVLPLAFDSDDNIITTPVNTSDDPFTPSYKMSWDVCFDLSNNQIKNLQPYIINLSKSVFGQKATKYTATYPTSYSLPEYLQGEPIVCNYNDLIGEEVNLFTSLYKQLLAAPSPVFTGIKNAIEEQKEINAEFNPQVYLIPIQAVASSNPNKKWAIALPTEEFGWTATSSVLYNGFDTNQLKSYSLTFDA